MYVMNAMPSTWGGVKGVWYGIVALHLVSCLFLWCFNLKPRLQVTQKCDFGRLVCTSMMCRTTLTLLLLNLSHCGHLYVFFRCFSWWCLSFSLLVPNTRPQSWQGTFFFFLIAFLLKEEKYYMELSLCAEVWGVYLMKYYGI